jgi:hypothetical protein
MCLKRAEIHLQVGTMVQGLKRRKRSLPIAGKTARREW